MLPSPVFRLAHFLSPWPQEALQGPLPKSSAFLLSPEPNVDTYIDIYFLYPEPGLCNQAWG